MPYRLHLGKARPQSPDLRGELGRQPRLRIFIPANMAATSPIKIRTATKARKFGLLVTGGPIRKSQSDFVVSLTDSSLAINEWATIMLG